ncbi:hypothetical protein PALB_23670 [Pseudoalteromonas luteoviolacea B = ATCC 29581]|nr:hypothetical protein PALB_23670 [Pseudoalteromonas luteoviolacea B = ATCC 29581]
MKKLHAQVTNSISKRYTFINLLFELQRRHEVKNCRHVIQLVQPQWQKWKCNSPLSLIVLEK